MDLDFKKALHDGLADGVDALPEEADERLLERLHRPRWPSWAWSAALTAAVAVAAVMIVARWTATASRPPAVVATPTGPPAASPADATGVLATADLVDVSKERWDGVLAPGHVSVDPSSHASAVLKWKTVELVAAPGTEVSVSDDVISLGTGALTISNRHRSTLTVVVGGGRSVFAAYAARMEARKDVVTITVDGGHGEAIDATGTRHELADGRPVRWQLAAAATPHRAAPARPPQPRAPAIATTFDPVPAPSPLRLSDRACTFNSDCGPHQTCRAGDTGAHVCMGDGASGASCWFDGDCRRGACRAKRCTPAEGE